jgi:hypothetical protein
MHTLQPGAVTGKAIVCCTGAILLPLLFAAEYEEPADGKHTTKQRCNAQTQLA